MSQALGMIETRGYIASVVAADAMMKSANVTLIKQESVDAGLMTILVTGDVGAVQAALDAGKEAAKRVGVLISAHMIARPYDEINEIVMRSGLTARDSQPRVEEPNIEASRKKGAENKPNSDNDMKPEVE